MLTIYPSGELKNTGKKDRIMHTLSEMGLTEAAHLMGLSDLEIPF